MSPRLKTAEPTKEPFADWVIRHMEERGWKDPQLARKAELPEKTIGRIRTGASTDVRMRTFVAIVTAFGKEPFTVYNQVTLSDDSGDSSTARERSYAVLGMLAESGDLALAGANG